MSLTVLADAVLPLKRPKQKPREPVGQERAPATAYDDAIPFARSSVWKPHQKELRTKC